MNPLRNLLLALPAAAALLSIASYAKAPKQADVDAAKANYIFFEAQRAMNEDRYTDWNTLLRKAYRLNPSDRDIAGNYGEYVFVMGIDDREEMEAGYQDMARLFFENPSDYVSGLRFIEAAKRNDRSDDVIKAYKVLIGKFPDRPEYKMQYADYLVESHQSVRFDSPLDTAMSLYRHIESLSGPTFDIVARQAAIYELWGDTVKALDEVRRIYRIAPNDPETLVDIAASFDYFSIPDSAAYYYDRACEADSSSGYALYSRANYYLQQGDTVRYCREIDEVLRSTGVEFEDKNRMLARYCGNFLGDESRRPEIDSLFAVMDDQYTSEPALHGLYGEFLSLNGDQAAAAEQYGFAAGLAPEEENYFIQWMECANAAGDTVGAIAAGRAAIQHFPENIYYPIYINYMVKMTESPENALALLDSFDIAKEERPGVVSTYYEIRGDLLYQMGRRDSAFADYEKAVVYKPDNVGALNNAAYYMAVEGVNLDRAEQMIRRVMTLEGDNPTYIDTYAWVLFKQKDYPAARRQIDRVFELYEAYSEECDSVECIEDYEIEEVVAADTVYVDDTEISVPKPSAEVYDHAGDIYFMNGEPQIALEFWEKALALDPENEKIKKKVQHKTYFFE